MSSFTMVDIYLITMNLGPWWRLGLTPAFHDGGRTKPPANKLALQPLNNNNLNNNNMMATASLGQCISAPPPSQGTIS